MQKPDLFDPFEPITVFSKYIGEITTQWIENETIRSFMAYWVYDFIKVSLLLIITSTIMKTIRELIGIKWLRKRGTDNSLKGILAGTMLGIFTPVCSCSVTPLYVSLINSGISKKSAAAFLFAAPAVNEFAIVIMYLTLGFKGAVIYAIIGITAAIITGIFAEKLGLEPCNIHNLNYKDDLTQANNIITKIYNSLLNSLKLYKNLILPIIIGTLLASILVRFNMHPVSVVLQIGNEWWAPIIATIIGLPLDINAASTLPILIPLAQSGIQIGTIISLTLATTVASIPEAIILKSIIGIRGVLKLGLWYMAYCSLVGIIINLLKL